jgi:hypothetical protein
MKRIGLADHVIVVLSNKYLRSPYCMTELYSIYQRSVGRFCRLAPDLRAASLMPALGWLVSQGSASRREFWE